MSVELEPPPIVEVHTPSTSFAISHSCKLFLDVRIRGAQDERHISVTQDTLESLFHKLTKKINASPGKRGDLVGPGWVKYDWNENVWSLDDGMLHSRLL